MIVWLASYPRSGNTFFRILLHHICEYQTYSIYDDPVLRELGAEETVGQPDKPVDLDALRSSSEVHFVKTHELRNDEQRAIYIVRDGRDAVVSHARFLADFQAKRNPVNAVLSRLMPKYYFRKLLVDLITRPRGGWTDHVRSWLWSGPTEGAAA